MNRTKRPALLVAAAVLAALAAAPRPTAARAEAQDEDTGSVAAVNGVVVHGVDRKLLAARVRETDVRAVAGETSAVAKALAELTTSDLGMLLEEGEGVWISAQESVLQRVAKLPPEGLAEYRSILDGRAAAALAEAAARRDAAGLARDAVRYAYTTPGPRLLLLLADVRLAQGELSLAARALEDLLRLLPAHAAPDVLARAASRLAALLAAQGDAPGIRALAAELPAAALDGPSPLDAAAKLRDELARAATIAERAATAPEGPAGALQVAAELQLGAERRESGVGGAGREPGTLRERPVAIGAAGRPALLVRWQNQSRTNARVVALGLPEPEAALPGEPRRIATFRPLWSWPSSVSEEPRPAAAYPFAPVLLPEGAVVFTWPVPPSEVVSSGGRFSEHGEERHQLAVLSLAAEGKLVEERGRYEADRDDGDPELERLSFCGTPAVDGRAVYVTAVRHAARGDPTELHVCRFDVVAGGGGRLRLRWRRHVLDGRPMPPALFKARETWDLAPGIALPTSPVVKAGRVFVGSNTGAVACVDAATGSPEWVETYDRFGPSSRTTVRESELASWNDVPLFADGPYLYAAPADGESVIQYRRAPRAARSVRVEDFVFAGPNGTARRSSRLLPDLIPTDLGGVRDGMIVLSGRVARRPFAATPLDGSPLAAFRLDRRDVLVAQVQEYAASAPPAIVRGGILFPTPKAIYRVRLDAFESPPETLWRHAGGGDPYRGADRIGVLVPDGARLWSVTPTRILLLEPAR